MAFCTRCGKQLADTARFCVSCGAPHVDAGSTPTTPDQVVPPLEYKIEGDNLQILRITLRPGQEIFAEAGKMVYKTTSVSWETRASGHTLGEKLWGMLKRSMGGESLFFTYFRC